MARSVNKEPRFPGLMSEENVPAPKAPSVTHDSEPQPQSKSTRKPPTQVKVNHMMAPAMITALDRYCADYEISRSNAIRNFVRQGLLEAGYEIDK